MAVTKEKAAAVAELKEKLSGAKAVVLTNYRGLTVAQDTKFRRKMREAGVEYRVAKNTMTRIAAKDLGLDDLVPHLEGPTALAFSYSDPVAPAKVISDFIRENRLQSVEIKAGAVEGKVIGADGVKALANLPPKEVLIATVLGTMQAPITGLAVALSGTIGKVVHALEAIRKQKESA